MSLVKWRKRNTDPFRELFEMDHPFWGMSVFPLSELASSNNLGNVWCPALDVSADEKNVYVKADLPGIKKEDISLSVENGVLTMRGERKMKEEKTEKNIRRIECSYGSFERRVDLGANVDESKAQASYNDGVFEIILPKAQNAPAKSIEIK